MSIDYAHGISAKERTFNIQENVSTESDIVGN
jgi:hypothetical protein